MDGHSPWRPGLNLRKVNVRIVVGKVTLEYAFVRAFLFILSNIIPSVRTVHSYVPVVM